MTSSPANTTHRALWRSPAVPAAFALLALAAVAAFWKPYLSQLTAPAPMLLHLHAGGMALWCGLLIVQPCLILSGRRDMHRRLGRLAWVLAPVIVVSSLMLAVTMTRPATGTAIEDFRYGLFFVQVSGTAVFACCVAGALRQRHHAALHARWMIASGISFIDPVFARVFTHLGPSGPWVEAYGSILLTDLVVLAGMVAERHAAHGRGVLPRLAAMLVVAQAGGLWIDGWTPWRRLMDAMLA